MTSVTRLSPSLSIRELTAPEVAALARHANPKVTLGLYAKLAEGGFGH
jgi:hypothetical protein